MQPYPYTNISIDNIVLLTVARKSLTNNQPTS